MRESQSSSAARVVRAILASSDGTAPGTEGGDARAARAGAARAGAAAGALRVVDEARPARTVAAGVAAAGGADDGAARRLRELVTDHLADSAERWTGTHDALAGHRGTLPELLAAAPAPAPPPAADELRAPVPRSAQATLALLMAHARPEHAAAALAALPDRTLQALLGGGTLPAPSLITAVVEHGDPRTRTALAQHPRLDPRVLARLLTVGDARLAAAVYRNPRATPSLRRTLVARLDTVPMDDALRAELTAPRGDVPGTWLAPLLASGDPRLVARALPTGVRGVAQQYALLRVWERTGPEAVRTLLDDPAAAPWLSGPVVKTVTAALAEDDGSGAAVRALRERCEPYEDPARLPALLATTRGTSSLRDLLAEPYVHDIDALAEAHAKAPFMPKACAELARHEAASDAQRLAFRLSVLNEPWRAGGRRAGNATPPERRLAEEPLDADAARWAEGMVAAGLLDPVELVRTARPAAHAVRALAMLNDRALLTSSATTELRMLADTHLGDRADAWAALDDLLPEHAGSVAELFAAAGRAVDADGDEGAGAGSVEPEPEPASAPMTTAAPASAPAPAPTSAPAPARVRGELPPSPRDPHGRAALAALDLLLSLAPAGAPLPADPDTLRFLAAHDQHDAPGLATPAWLVQAVRDCAAFGGEAPDDEDWFAAPSLAAVTAQPPESFGASATVTELAYAQGILPADELLGMLPAGRMLLLPYDWRKLGFAHAWRAALARRLRAELGTDPDAWLRLAATAEAAVPLDGPASDGPSWAELLDLARSGSGTDAHRSPQGGGTPGAPTPRPRTPDEALGLLERGNHLWAWPMGTLLSLADAEVIDAVLPRLGPDGPWLLAAYLLRYGRTPRVLFERLLARRDPHALRVLAAQCRWLPDGLVARLVDLDDPDVDLAVLRHPGNPHLARRIVARSRPSSRPRPGAEAAPESPAPSPTVGAQVLAELRADPSAHPAGGLAWLSSAEPDLIEEIFARQGTELNLAHQLTGCLHLFRHGGADRLARLARNGQLGQAATKLCVKALASDDPSGVIRARLDRELAPAKLITKIRRARHRWQATNAVTALPAGADWQALEEAHGQEPLPHWDQLVNLPEAPTELRMRHAALIREPGPDGLAEGAELTRARARHGLTGLYHCAPTTQLDGLLAADLLSGRELLYLAAPAGRLLAYLNAAARRTDAPAGAAAARTELTALVRSRLGTDAAAWERVTDRLTGRDPSWDPVSPTTALLT